MRNKIILFVVMSIFLISFASAYEQGECVDIRVESNATDINITTIEYPNSSVAVSNQIMSNLIPYSFNYTFCSTDVNGEYTYGYFDDLGNTYSSSFLITPNGFSLDTAKSVLFSLLIASLIIVLFVFITYAYREADYGWRIGYYIGAYLSAFFIAFVGYLIINNYVPEFAVLSDLLNLAWIVMAILAPILLMLLAFSLLREQSKELAVRRKQKYGYSREEATR